MTQEKLFKKVPTMSRKRNPNEPPIYQIRVSGQLGEQWTAGFGQLELTLADNGDTLLTGPVVDQAALHGLLRRVRDLGVPLISVIQVQDISA